MYKLRQGDPDGGSSGHPDDEVGAEEGRGHCCSANHDDDDDEECWKQVEVSWWRSGASVQSEWATNQLKIVN